MLNNQILVGNTISKQSNSTITKPNLQNELLELEVSNSLQQVQSFFDYFQKRIAEITKQGVVRIYEVIQNKDKTLHRFINEFQAHQGQIFSLSWQSAKYDNMIVTCGIDRKVIIWKEIANLWKQEKVFQCQDTVAKDVQWAENKFMLAVGYQNGILDVIECKQYKITNTTAYSKELLCLDWLKNGHEQVLVTGGLHDDQYMVRIWNVLSDEQTIIDKVFEIKVDSTINSVKFAPQIFSSELQLAIGYGTITEIFTLEYNQEFIKPITILKQQRIELDTTYQRFTWSLLGDELTINTGYCEYSLYQNENNEFQVVN